MGQRKHVDEQAAAEAEARLRHPSTLTDPNTPAVYRTSLWCAQWVQCGHCGEIVSTEWLPMSQHYDTHR